MIKSFFTKEEIIQRADQIRAEYGADNMRADFNLALIILGSSLFQQKLRSGHDYGVHPVTIAMRNTHSTTKQIIKLLHDVVEDSDNDWTLDDLRRVGFSERIVLGVDAMTHRPGELYFDGQERCSQNPDGLDNKIEDQKHNMELARNQCFMEEKDVERNDKYSISHAYNVAVKKGLVKAGSSLPAFARQHPEFSKRPERLEYMLNKYSSHPKQ